MEKPKYRVGQMLKAEHSWARDIPPRPVLDIMFDKSWNCYTYSFPRSLIRLEEYHLNPVDLPDMTPDEWEQWNGKQEARQEVVAGDAEDLAVKGIEDPACQAMP